MSFGLIASGLVFGCLAGLNSIGFILLWRTQRVVNLAQPALGLVGGTVTGLLVVSAGWSFWTAAPVGLFVGVFLASAAHFLVFRRLRTAPRSALLIATVGVAAVFGGIASALPFIVGGPLPTYSLDLGLQLDLFPVRLLGPHLLALVLFSDHAAELKAVSANFTGKGTLQFPLDKPLPATILKKIVKMRIKEIDGGMKP